MSLKGGPGHFSGEPTVLVNRGWVPATWQEERETEAHASADTTGGSRQASEANKHGEGQSSQVSICKPVQLYLPRHLPCVDIAES